MPAPRAPAIRSPLPGLLTRFLADESGATAVEYGMICAGVIMTIAATLRLIGSQLFANILTPVAASISSQ